MSSQSDSQQQQHVAAGLLLKEDIDERGNSARKKDTGSLASLRNLDPWCPLLWWPIRLHHLPREGCGWWVLIVLSSMLWPGVTAFRARYIGNPSFHGPAADLADLALILWLVLVPIILSDILSVTHPEHGCVAKLWRSVQEAGAAPTHCGALVTATRVVAIVVRVCAMSGGLGWFIWMIEPIFRGETGHCCVWDPLGAFFGGLLGAPLGGTWLISLFLCVDLALASIVHLITTRITGMSCTSDLENVEEARWQREMLEPTRALVRDQLPLLSRFGFSIGCVVAVATIATISTLPRLVAAFNGNDDGTTVFLMATTIGMYLLLPLLLLLVPTRLSTWAGKELIDAVHEMRPNGAGFRADRVTALETYLRGVNFGQGPGFAVFKFVVTMTQLSTAATSLVAVYPVVVYLIEEYS
jgi:hypothetical protein